MKLIFHFILVLLVARSKSEKEKAENEEAQVNWTNTTGPSSKQDSHPSLPDNVVLTLTMGNETAVLNLVKDQNDNFEEIPVIEGTNEDVKIWHHSRDEEFSVYSDKSKDASFSVVVNTENGTTTTEYHGSFVHKGTKYTLTPAKYYEESAVTAAPTHTFSLNGTQYVVSEDPVEPADKEATTAKDFEKPDLEHEAHIPEKTDHGPSSEDIVVKEATDHGRDPDVPEVTVRPEVESNPGDINQERSQRRKRSLSMNLVVDLMVIIDNSMYMRWLGLNDDDKDKTIEQIRYFLAFVINGVNNVYTSMKSSQLTFKVVGIFIAETTLQSNYLENSKLNADEKNINFDKALDGFRDWVNNHTPKNEELPSQEKFLQRHDIAIAFTDYNNKPVEGFASVGAICGDHSQGIVHAVDHYGTISTTAHEIGHVLGCNHDGDGNTCNPHDQYVMTNVMVDTKIENRNKLSSCSIDQIKAKLSELESDGQNCLDPSKKQRQRLNLDKLLASHPGVHFGPDLQCKLKFGDGYKFCSNGADTSSTMCNKLKCLKIEDNNCYGSQGKVILLDGTTCGKGKWCMEGNCVVGAPVKPKEKETCYFGDKSDSFIIGEKSMQCEDFLNETKLCYNNDGWCCETCEKIKLDKQSDNLPANCAYGDKGLVISMGSKKYGCELVLRRPDLCLDPQYLENCCESCSKAKDSDLERPSECQDEESINFNHQLVACKSLLHDPSKCYDLESYCCQTCSKVKNEEVPDCPYGDRGMIIKMDEKNYGCELVLEMPDLCQKEKYVKHCCESCGKAKKTQKTPDVPTGVTEDTCKDVERFQYNGQVNTCEFLQSNPAACYDLEQHCCKTCADIKNKKALPYANCPYGDRGIVLKMGNQRFGCELFLTQPGLCSQSHDKCCESCGKAKEAQKTPDESTGVSEDTCKDVERFQYKGQVNTCEFLENNPAACYALEQHCCKTCAGIKNKKALPYANCPYGDRGIVLKMGNQRFGCELFLTHPGLCSQSHDNCCESCGKAKEAQKTPDKSTGVSKGSCTDMVNLKYEGQILDCKSLLKDQGKCYQLKRYCCQTCADIKRAKVAKLGPNCPYGDQIVNLTIQNKQYNCMEGIKIQNICLDSQIAKYCCESCFGVKLGQRPIIPEFKNARRHCPGAKD